MRILNYMHKTRENINVTHIKARNVRNIEIIEIFEPLNRTFLV